MKVISFRYGNGSFLSSINLKYIILFNKYILKMDHIVENAYLNYLSPEFALPRCSALLFAGSALYVGFLDPIVRNKYENPRTNLHHWSGVAKVSQIAMNVLAGVTGALGLNAFRLTRDPLWAWGSLAILAAIPFSLFGMKSL